jgi:hypothetical protein
LTKFITLGLTYGFSLHYKGDLVNATPQNHQSALDNSYIVSEKIHKEIMQGGIMGPFDDPPMKPFFCSPISPVPKKGKEEGKFRTVHNLSFPKDKSVNCGTPKEFTRVNYDIFDHFVEILVETGQASFMAKADIESAFRILPIHPKDYWLLGFHGKENIALIPGFLWVLQFHVQHLNLSPDLYSSYCSIILTSKESLIY